jgi:hypothetical protein
MIRMTFTALVAYLAAVALALVVLFVIALGKLALPARAQGTPGLPLVPIGFCQLTPLAAATTLSSCSGGGIPARASLVVLRAESATVRYRDDGVAPTAAIGQPILTTDRPLVYVGTLSALQFIAASGSPTLDVAFYRSP